MQITFKKAFLKDVKKLHDKTLKEKIRNTITQAEKAKTLDVLPMYGKTPVQ